MRNWNADELIARSAIKRRFNRRLNGKAVKKPILPVEKKPRRPREDTPPIDLYSRWYKRFGLQNCDTGVLTISGESRRLLEQDTLRAAEASKTDKPPPKRPI